MGIFQYKGKNKNKIHKIRILSNSERMEIDIKVIFVLFNPFYYTKFKKINHIV